MDQALSKNLGLGDSIFGPSVLNVMDADPQYFINQVPTVKTARRMLLVA